MSEVGADGNAAFDADAPALAHNTVRDEYLAVWAAEDTGTDGESEIFGRRLDGDGRQLGAEFRVSDMGPNGDATFDALDPAITYNSAANEYFVTWRGDDNTVPLVDEEFEVYGQRISANGNEVGTNDLRISDMGPDGDPAFQALGADDVAYNSQNNQYLVTWTADDDAGGVVDQEQEVFGQRVSAAGAEIGTNDFRISDVGGDGLVTIDATDTAVVYNSQSDEYLVVFRSEDNVGGLVDQEFEILGQRLSAAGADIGANDFRISDMGPNADTSFIALTPDVAYNSLSNEYLVTWRGDDNTAPLVNDESEIFGQRLSAAGAETGANDFRISDMGPNGGTTFGALLSPAVAYNPTDNEYLVTWSGDDNTAPLLDEENEVFGQRLSSAGAELGANDFRISDMGPSGDANFDAGDEPAVAYSPQANEFMVAWSGDDNTTPLVNDENEIYARRVRAGLPVGAQGLGGTNGTDGTNGTNGTVGAQGSGGANGTNGTNGTNGRDGVSKLVLVAFAASPSKAKAGKRVTVRYLLTDTAKVTLAVKAKTGKAGKAGKAVQVASQVGRGGVGRISWNGKLRGKAAKAGKYTLTVTAERDGQKVSSALEVRTKAK